MKRVCKKNPHNLNQKTYVFIFQIQRFLVKCLKFFHNNLFFKIGQLTYLIALRMCYLQILKIYFLNLHDLSLSSTICMSLKKNYLIFFRIG